jgi:hypothetical protein
MSFTKEMIANMTKEELKELASHMFNPIRCGGLTYDEKGRPMYIHGGIPRTPKEHNDFIRAANPKWSEENLKPYFQHDWEED